MGDHDTWYTLLPFWHDLERMFEEGLRRDWRALMFQDTHFTLVHVMGALIAATLILIATLRYRAMQNSEETKRGLLPSPRLTLGAMVDGIVGAVYRLSRDVMSEEDAKRYLPLTGTLALFIFACNIQGLIPGFLPPTDTLKTNLALALLIFVIYNVAGIVRNGVHYADHFLGPKIGGFRLLAPLFLIVETASHIARPVSLSLRLMGNILADHKVVIAIASLVAILLPVPFLLLGVLVAIIQTLIFTLLSIIYIGMAVEPHAEH
jgi:F-type H+-transporting ATPase subunit a